MSKTSDPLIEHFRRRLDEAQARLAPYANGQRRSLDLLPDGKSVDVTQEWVDQLKADIEVYENCIRRLQDWLARGG